MMGTKEYLYNVGDVIVTNRGNINILNRIVIPRKTSNRKDKGYTVICCECSSTYNVSEASLKKGVGCVTCFNNKHNRTSDYMYSIGDIVKTRCVEVEITDKAYINNGKYKRKGYVVRCCECNDVIEISESHLKSGDGCFSCAIKKTNSENRIYIYSIGDVVIYKNGSVEVLDTIMMNNGKNGIRKGYLLKCLECGEIFKSHEKKSKSSFKGCPVCTNKKVVKGINDIATTHPHLLRYFVSIDDAYEYTYGSNGKVLVKCPVCGNEKVENCHKLATFGMICDKCGDGQSYPNKFVTSLLDQLGVKFSTEVIFEWSKEKRYDHFLTAYNCIIENHGEQHYKQSSRGRSLQEEQENDKLKYKMALNNGVKNYIELDCRKSDAKWIKDNIMTSDLPKLLGFIEDDIDWTECHRFALSSLVKEACDMWNSSNLYTPQLIADKLNISKYTVLEYLRKGSKLNICNYKSKRSSCKNIILNNEIYLSAEHCANYLGINKNTLRSWILNKNPIPQKYIDMGLRYATQEEIDQYIASKEVNKVS